MQPAYPPPPRPRGTAPDLDDLRFHRALRERPDWLKPLVRR